MRRLDAQPVSHKNLGIDLPQSGGMNHRPVDIQRDRANRCVSLHSHAFNHPKLPCLENRAGGNLLVWLALSPVHRLELWWSRVSPACRRSRCVSVVRAPTRGRLAAIEISHPVRSSQDRVNQSGHREADYECMLQEEMAPIDKHQHHDHARSERHQDPSHRRHHVWRHFSTGLRNVPTPVISTSS